MSELQWAVTAYVLALAVVTPAAESLSPMHAHFPA
jgi:hypothetical protein